MNDHDAPPAPLQRSTLNSVPKDIQRPKYNRSDLTPGIVHIGLGNFHRAHQAWYLHRIMQDGRALDWAIVGASVRHQDNALRQKLLDQDCLTTLISLDPSSTSAEIVGSMIDYLPIEDGHGALIRQMSDPQIRIVSLTVTEGGYFLDPATKTFDADHPDMLHDADNLHAPRSAFGAIVAALRNRRAAGHAPFTCQSCDNLPGNGAILSEVVTGLANMADPDLGSWIADTVSFPNSMVDCIVPATGPSELALARKIGVADLVPVTHENFRQWVIEDDFCAGRPPWEDVGVTISKNVHDYEAMKLRVLNGGHQMIANPAEILGLATIAETMAHPLIAGMFRKIAHEEIAPHVATVPGMSPAQYIDLIEKRFANPAIVDTVRRVAFDGSSRHTGAVLPVIRDAIAANAPLSGLALSQAMWARMCTGIREDGSEIEPNDPLWSDLVATARAAQTNPEVWLQQQHFYAGISESMQFKDAFCLWMRRLSEAGTEQTLRDYVSPHL